MRSGTGRALRRSSWSRRGAIAFALLAIACASADRASPDDGPTVVVRPVPVDGVVEYEAVIRLEATPREVEDWLLDFDRAAADRPAVLEAALVRREEDAWLARFRLRGLVGVNPSALTRTTRRTDGTAVVLAFRSVETSFGLSELRGFYRIEPRADGGSTLVHRLYVDSPFVTEEGRHRDMLEDARAIRARFASP